MIATVLIITFSLALFIYWFRYSCLLLLRRSAEQTVPAASGFSYVAVQQNLPDAVELDPLSQALDRDYRLLTYLLDHAAGLELEKLEYRLLVLDYRLMQGWYRLTKSAAPRQARRAIGEMADVLNVLAGRIGEHAGVRSEV
ncbi:MAG TPA: hypothetical protein VMB03_06000 [Bryobacteraceae bacterium]|nr:hypothetical protein [Bryobacteraceae bacterium]